MFFASYCFRSLPGIFLISADPVLTQVSFMRSKLTPAFAVKAQAAPSRARTTYWDAGMPGFGLMVTANGHRSYVVQYRAAADRGGCT